MVRGAGLSCREIEGQKVAKDRGLRVLAIRGERWNDSLIGSGERLER